MIIIACLERLQLPSYSPLLRQLCFYCMKSRRVRSSLIGNRLLASLSPNQRTTTVDISFYRMFRRWKNTTKTLLRPTRWVSIIFPLFPMQNSQPSIFAHISHAKFLIKTSLLSSLNQQTAKLTGQKKDKSRQLRTKEAVGHVGLSVQWQSWNHGHFAMGKKWTFPNSN